MKIYPIITVPLEIVKSEFIFKNKELPVIYMDIYGTHLLKYGRVAPAILTLSHPKNISKENPRTPKKFKANIICTASVI